MGKVLPYLLALFLLFGAYNHIANPDFYLPIIPPFVPAWLANIFAAVTEGLIGLALLIPKYQRVGGLAFMILMLIFLPLHIWEIFREVPMMQTFQGVLLRLLIQFVLIGIGWWIWKRK